MGKMIDAQSIVVSSTATQQVGREAAIFQVVFKHSVVLGLPGRCDRDAVCLRVPRDHPRGDRGQVGPVVPAGYRSGFVSGARWVKASGTFPAGTEGPIRGERIRDIPGRHRRPYTGGKDPGHSRAGTAGPTRGKGSGAFPAGTAGPTRGKGSGAFPGRHSRPYTGGKDPGHSRPAQPALRFASVGRDRSLSQYESPPTTSLPAGAE